MSQPYKEISFEELASLYCERQKCTPKELRAKLEEQKRTFPLEGWVLLENCDFWRTQHGRLVILPYGPMNTLKAPPDPEQAIEIHQLPGNQFLAQAILPAKNFV